MKILVAVKRVVDYNVRVRVKSDNSGVETANVKMSMNPFDEIAVEQAIQLKEKGIASEVIVVSIGSAQSQDVLHHALALGADRGILVETTENYQPLSIAKILRKITQQETPSLVLLGKQAIDGDNNQTGQMLAGLLDCSQGTFISSLEINDDQVVVVREVDEGTESLTLTMPAVITTDLRLNTPRLPSIPNIMKAKKKPLGTISIESLGLDLQDNMQVISVTKPAERQAGLILDSIDEVFDKLKNEAQVI